jgi:ketosteroid isomerase-like protein
VCRTVGGISLLLALLNAGPGQTSRSSERRSEHGVTDGTLVREVTELKRQYDVAQLGNDAKWFEQMLAEDYVFIGSDGSMSSKSDVVKDMQSRDLVWESVAVKDMRIRVYGDTAVVTGRFFGKGRYKGSPLDERQRFTSVWIKRSGRWQGISEQGSKLNASDDH